MRFCRTKSDQNINLLLLYTIVLQDSDSTDNYCSLDVSCIMLNHAASTCIMVYKVYTLHALYTCMQLPYFGNYHTVEPAAVISFITFINFINLINLITQLPFLLAHLDDAASKAFGLLLQGPALVGLDSLCV